MPRPSRRQQILDAALECFADLGFESTRVADIAVRAGVTPPAIYSHFASVQALAEEIYLIHFTKYATQLELIVGSGTGVRDELSTIIRATISYYRREPAAFTFVSLRLVSFLSRPFEGAAYPIDSVASVVRDGQRAGIVRDGDPHLLASLFFGALLRPMHIAQFSRTHGVRLAAEHDPVIEAACLAVLIPEQSTVHEGKNQ